MMIEKILDAHVLEIWTLELLRQRLINCRGPGSAQRQAEALQAEGVNVTSDSMGEYYVSLAHYGWFPSELPSEAE